MVAEETRPSRRRFPPRPSSVREARAMIRQCLVAAGRDDLVETAELVVSEIVTNALVHAGTPIEVGISLVGGGLRIEVTDGSPHAPTPRAYGPSAGTGRGLMLIEEMVDEWGVTPSNGGKTVWFQIACDGRPPESHAIDVVPPAHRELLDVHLIDVPLLLHEAWRQHAESLLREFLLANLDDGAEDDAILAHSEASDAIALLAEHVPSSGVPDEAAQVMVTATEPLVSSPLVVVPVPVTSVPHFETLERTMTSALSLVEAGEFLTPPVQPELQGLRAWLCGEVRRQSKGKKPRPWSSDHEPPATPLREQTWDLRRAHEAVGGMVVADDEDRIIAVSPSALHTLGYDDAGGIVGHRLIELIPERYRQAHLAGFTMHFLTGRSTLLDQSVVVPALRGDGSEVDVELTVRAERTPDGRTVFVADLEPVA